MHGKRLQCAIKRVFDLATSASALLVLAPLIVVVALLVRWKMGAPVLFRQRRPGLHGKPFTMVKFRTMRDAYDASGRRLPDAERITRLGRLLRSTSLDELPELWNILKGEMSWVGPRPLMMEYLPRYSSEQARRHDVTPGLTGWAQVNGRNAQTWEERFRLDVYYVDHWSLGFDLRILARTVRTVLRREGIGHDASHEIMPAFMGTSQGERD